MTTASQDRIGTTIAGYRIERLLARGGMSVVYAAEDLRLGRKVALKVLAPELAEDERFRGRFLRESRIAASLDHSHVIPIYEAGEADGLLYIAMRFVEGTELRTVIREQGPLPPQVAVGLVTQAASALDAAHARGLVHRDVKPGNILLADEGGRGARRHVYLSDFGLTKQALSDSGLTETGQFVGTADYIAPEQIEGREVGPWSDVYALACVLFECLTGQPPFPRSSLMAVLWAHVHDPPPSASERRTEVPRAIDAVIARGMAKAPDGRYETCAALAEAACVALGLPVASRRPSLAERVARRPVLALGTIAAVAAAGALVLGLVLIGRGGDDPRATTAIRQESLQRIDAASGRLAATVPLGSAVAGLAAGPGAVWAVDSAGRYRRVDRATDAVSSTGSTAGEPSGIDVGLGSVWIASSEGATATTGTVTEVDPRTGRATRVIPVPVLQRVPNQPTFGGIAVDESAEAGRSLWVASPFSLALKRIRPRLGTVVSTVPIGNTPPRTLAVGEGGLWVTTWFALVRVDPSRNAVAARVELPFDPRDVAAGAGAVWIVNGTGNSIWMLDPESNRVTDRIPVGAEPVAVAVAGGAVWVANRRDGTVSRVDPERGAVTATVHVGGRPNDIAADADGAVWVAAHPDVAGAGRLSERTYLAAVEAITDRAFALGDSALEPFYHLRARSKARIEPFRVPPQLGHEVVAINRAQIAELSELEPPGRFAGDHARYLGGLRRLGSLHERLADAVEGRQGAEADAIASEINSFEITLRSDLSPEFREVVPRHPLACC